MDNYLLEKLTREIKISPLNIIRENAEVIFLDKLGHSGFAGKLIFYGGTSLRLSFGSPRFSEDLDFLMTGKITEGALKDLLIDLSAENPGFSLKDIKLKRNTLFALFNVVHSSLKYPLNIKIEISRKENGIKAEYVPLSSPCSNLAPIILTASIQSLEKLKTEAIRQRMDAKDWFDSWYIAKYLKKTFVLPVPFPFDAKEFKRELKRFLPQDKWALIDQIHVGNRNIAGTVT